jgi:hypothetical protein
MIPSATFYLSTVGLYQIDENKYLAIPIVGFIKNDDDLF